MNKRDSQRTSPMPAMSLDDDAPLPFDAHPSAPPPPLAAESVQPSGSRARAETSIMPVVADQATWPAWSSQGDAVPPLPSSASVPFEGPRAAAPSSAPPPLVPPVRAQAVASSPWAGGSISTPPSGHVPSPTPVPASPLQPLSSQSIPQPASLYVPASTASEEAVESSFASMESASDDDGPPTQRSLPPRPPREVTLTLYASTQASLHFRPDEQIEILEREELVANEWTRAEERWDAEIQSAAQRGDLRLLEQFDEIYVERLEHERGHPIDVDTYAALELAVERGEVEIELARRVVPTASMFPVKRVWLRELMKDASLRQKFRATLDDKRRAG